MGWIVPDQIVRAVGRTGMRAEPWQDVIAQRPSRAACSCRTRT